MSHHEIVSGQDGLRANDHSEHDETTPLLPDGSVQQSYSESPDNDNSSTATTRTYFKTTAGIILLLIAVVPATSAMAPSLQRLIELTTCRAYYLQHNPSVVDSTGWVDEKFCKINEIQKQFAYITGWNSLFVAIPGLIMSVPIGALADSKGRKLVFALGMISVYASTLWIGIVSYFYKTFPNPKSIWIGSVFWLPSGGEGMFSAILYTMMADITSSKDLSSVFFRVVMLSLLLGVAGSELGAFLLDKGVYLSYKVLLPTTLLAFPVLFFMPETLYLRKTDTNVLVEEPEETTVPADLVALSRAASIRAAFQNLKDRLHKFRAEYVANLSSTLKLFTRERNILLCCFAMSATYVEFFAMVTYDNQFISKKFSWTLAKAAFISPVYDTFKVLVLFSLPYLTSYVRKRNNFSAPETDLLVSRWSMLAMSCGSFVVGFSPDIVTFIIGLFVISLGSGSGGALRSFVTFTVSKHQYAALYAGINVISTFSSLVAGPLFASVFSTGLNIGFIGLPFLALSIMQALSLCGLLFVRLKKQKTPTQPPPSTVDPEA